MKVAYVIFSNEHGTGGHHHSLKTIRDSIESLPKIECFTLNLGVAPSPVIQSNNNYKFFKANEFRIITNIFKILIFCKRNKIDVLHAFDINAYFYVRIISFFLRIPTLYIKCGGSNLKYNPRTKYAVATSEENFDYLKKQKKHEFLFLYENRIPSFSQNELENQKVRSWLKKDGKEIYLRITRITKYYEESIFKTIDFISKVDNSILVFLGSIYDENLHSSIVNHSKQKNVEVYFLSEEKYTRDSKQFIGIGDYIFGTGRAAMEVLACKRRLLSYVQNIEYPIIVDMDNFDFFRYYNFSERVKISDVYSFNNVIQNLKSNQGETEIDLLYKQFIKHYLITTRLEDYKRLYRQLIMDKNQKYYIKDFCENFYRHFLRSSIVFKYVLDKKQKS